MLAPTDSMSFLLPSAMAVLWALHLAAIPMPPDSLISVSSVWSAFFVMAKSAIALDSGWCEFFARLCATFRNFSSVLPALSVELSTKMPVTFGVPSVSVPVLSKITASILPDFSRVSPLLIRIPFLAPVPDATIIAVGVARPRAQGQAMISTATVGRMLASMSPVSANQMIKVSAAIPIIIGTKTPATLSARCWIGAFVLCALSTIWMICASTVSSPVLVILT